MIDVHVLFTSNFLRANVCASLQVLMKWSLHPAVGPRLRSGEPLIQPEDLPSDMQVSRDRCEFLLPLKPKKQKTFHQTCVCEFSLLMKQKTEDLPSDMQVNKGWCEFFVSLKQTITRPSIRHACVNFHCQCNKKLKSSHQTCR
jgi:hypothetical protein